jgi:hypothetical protein
MASARSRQATRLECLTESYLRPREKADSRFQEMVRNTAFIHTANLSALILYGNPKIDEPLSFAWRRCLESAEWQTRREKFGGWDEYGRDTCGDPFVSFGAARIAEYFRKYFLPRLPGTDEVEKFSLIFKQAPAWLLWFTYGDANAQILGIELPNLSTVNRFVRDPQNFLRDKLPTGPFECRLRADGSEDQVVWTKDWMLKKLRKKQTPGMSPRERKRIARVRVKYKNASKPLTDQEVITQVAVLVLLTRISGINHFDRY